MIMRSVIASTLAIFLYASVTEGGVLSRQSGYVRGLTGLGKDRGRIPVISRGKVGRVNYKRGADGFPAVSGGRRVDLYERGLLDGRSLLSGEQGGTMLDRGLYAEQGVRFSQGVRSANGLGRNSYSGFVFSIKCLLSLEHYFLVNRSTNHRKTLKLYCRY